MLGIFNLRQINRYIDKFFDYGYLYIKKDKNKILLFPTPKLIDDVFFKKI